MAKQSDQVSVRIPCFFKILLGDFTEKIRIPPAFIKNLNGKVIDESILRCPNGKVWPVKVKQDAGHLFFRKGWQDFVKDNSLEAGELLVFRYDGNSGFDVQIFGKSGCEKLGSLLRNKVQKRRKFISVCQCRYTYRPVISAKESGGKSLLKERTAVGVRTKRVFNGDACPLKLKHPHFTARWKLRKPYTVLIPKSFMREHNLGKKHTRFFRDPSGKLWPVNIIHSCNRSDFGSGWHDFRVGNNLGEGDRCIFEFMEGDEIQPIPRAFETEHDLRNNPSRFFCDPNGKLWPVRIYHSVGRSDFGAGWRDLLLANGVSEGCFSWVGPVHN
ncbi:hypothetical protein MRB53_007407 [Persea americana]|uniref:Uncharacterized protein n=1 Tax=Persea americana TaxID=3435 RepID=A0ACC2MJZ4_PERAE|nr:hypothetical protein MRB53_007407 [Persea americana]